MAAPPVPRRRAPLVAPGRVAVAPPAPVRPTVGRAVALGVGAAVATTGLVYGLAAGPIYILAQIATDGLQRPAFRTALLIALVVSVIAGLATGIATAVWHGRGGRLPSAPRPAPDGSAPPGR